jgi:CTP synthase
MMEQQKKTTKKGGTMRLGAYDCKLSPGSIAHQVYQEAPVISERHRHRFEFNNAYRERFAHSDLLASGVNPEENLVEIIELKGHPWFIGVQFHPELKSTVERPHPLFVHFVRAAMEYRQRQTTS